MTLHLGNHFTDVEQVLNEPTFQDRGGRRTPINTSRLVLEQSMEQVVTTNGYNRPPSTTNFVANPVTYTDYKVSRSYPNSTSGRDAKLQQPSPMSVNSAPENNQMDFYSGTLGNQGGITTIPKGTCASCRNPINGQIVMAMGNVWHPEHFTCAKCNDELGHRNFYERSGKVYCENDYFNMFFPRCAYCSGPIKDRCINAVDKTWHPEHFGCTACGKPFNEDGFHEKDGQAYCKKDFFALFAPKCKGCQKPVSSNFIIAWKSYWHQQCFTCATCKKPFDGSQQFFDLNGEPYCEIHYHEKRGSVCNHCRKPITGKLVTAMKKNYHPEHFLCCQCGQLLNKSNFKEFDRKALCQRCYTRIQL